MQKEKEKHKIHKQKVNIFRSLKQWIVMDKVLANTQSNG